MIFFPISKSTSQSEPFLVWPYFSLFNIQLYVSPMLYTDDNLQLKRKGKVEDLKKITESDVILWVLSKIIKSWKHSGAVVVKADAKYLSEKEKVILTGYPLPRGGKER